MGLYGHVYTHVSTDERGCSRVRRREGALGHLQSRCPWQARPPRPRPGWRARRPGWRFPLRQRQRHRLGTPCCMLCNPETLGARALTPQDVRGRPRCLGGLRWGVILPANQLHPRDAPPPQGGCSLSSRLWLCGLQHPAGCCEMQAERGRHQAPERTNLSPVPFYR